MGYPASKTVLKVHPQADSGKSGSLQLAKLECLVTTNEGK